MPDETQTFLEKFKGDIDKMRQAAPDMLKGFGGLFLNVMKDGALQRKQKELVAVGIALAQRCEPCIRLHVQKCLEAGNSPAEIIEAASVAVVMQGGPAYTYFPIVLETLESLASKPS